MIRRYKIDEQSGELVEVPLNAEQYVRLTEEHLQRLSQASRQVGRSLEMMANALQAVARGLMDVRIIHPSEHRFITPMVSPERIRLESIMTTWQGVWQPGQENPDYSPGGEEQHREVHLVLLDLIKAGRREDYEYMARYEAHVPSDKIDELWERTRRMHRLDP